MKTFLGWLSVGIVLVAVLGCRRRPVDGGKEKRGSSSNMNRAQTAGTGDEPLVQPGLPPARPGEPGLAFRILRVHEHRHLTETQPWHTSGGTWTMFDCSARGVQFTFGYRTKKRGRTFSWGAAVILASKRKSGASFVKAFADGFKTTVPPPVSPQPLKPKVFGMAILGTGLKRHPGGGFGGAGGGWVATKLFLNLETKEAEVYLNFNPGKRVGAFRMKDPDYTVDLVSVLAAVLRDGPRARRTPASDPNLVAHGPIAVNPRPLGSPKARYHALCPGGRFVMLSEPVGQLGSVLVRADPARPSTLERGPKLAGKPNTVHCLDKQARRLLVEESLPKDPHTRSSDDPVRIWWVERGRPPQQLVWKRARRLISLGERPLSPTRRYLVVTEWRDRTKGRGRYSVVHILNRRTGRIVVIAKTNRSFHQAGWRRVGGKLRVLLRSGFSFEKNVRYHLADPDTGHVQATNERPQEEKERRSRSPGGRYVIRVEKGKRLVVRDVKTRREKAVAFHPDDRAHGNAEQLHWVSSRYLFFDARHPMFVDLTTMKMNHAAAPRTLGAVEVWSPSFNWVLHRHQERLHVSRINKAGLR